VTIPPASALDPSRRLTIPAPQAAPLAAGLATAPLPIPLANSRQKLEVLFNSHPNLKMIDLSPEDIKQLAPLKSINIGGGATLLYW
jgi:hypothetical protein